MAISCLGLGDQVGALGVQLQAVRPGHFICPPLNPCTTQSLNAASPGTLLSQCPARVVVWFLGSATHVQSQPTTNQALPILSPDAQSSGLHFATTDVPVSPRLFCRQMRLQRLSSLLAIEVPALDRRSKNTGVLVPSLHTSNRAGKSSVLDPPPPLSSVSPGGSGPGCCTRFPSKCHFPTWAHRCLLSAAAENPHMSL